MKIVRFTSQAKAQAEADRLITSLDLPSGMVYGEPWQIEDGTWVLKVKEEGSYPVGDVIQGEIENYDASLT